MDDSVTRGEFLAAGAGAGVALAAGRRPRHRRRPRHHRRPIEQIEHIVVLMQENRSFDTYFGTLSGVRGFSDPHALRLPSGKSVFHQPYVASPEQELVPWRLDTSSNSPCNPLIDNSWKPMHDAYNNGRMDGWTRALGPNTMSYYDRRDVPWHMALADAFTVCEGYHASVLGPTNPNRYMMWTGTIDPRGRHGGPAIDNSGKRYTWTTYPERLQRAGISWRVYHESDDFDDNVLKFFAAYQDAKPGSPLYENAIVNRPLAAFGEDVARNRLPRISWLVAPTADSEHPGYSAGRGADYCNRVLGMLFAHERVWAKTAFILTYDEPGGFFDHVAPPTPRPGTRDEFVQGLPIGLGFRVPTVVCSPWSRGGFKHSHTLDHTSLIRLMEHRFGVKEPQISAWRRRVCGDMRACFDFTHRPNHTIPHLPRTAPLARAADDACAHKPQALPPVLNGPVPRQEPGRRRVHRR